VDTQNEGAANAEVAIAIVVVPAVRESSGVVGCKNNKLCSTPNGGESQLEDRTSDPIPRCPNLDNVYTSKPLWQNKPLECKYQQRKDFLLPHFLFYFVLLIMKSNITVIEEKQSSGRN
jgi:hypothetical protein